MSKSKLFIYALMVAVLLSACSNSPAASELDEKDTDKAVAKVEQSEPVEAKEVEVEEPAEEDIWTYYDNATWSDDFLGLKTEIMKVVVSDRAPRLDDDTKFDASAVGVKFRIENTTEGIFTTYPDQAVLVTSTGEQIDSPEMFISDRIGGDIEKGVIKEGNIIWYLERGHAEDITWVKIKWNAREGDSFEAERKEYGIELQLK